MISQNAHIQAAVQYSVLPAKSGVIRVLIIVQLQFTQVQSTPNIILEIRQSAAAAPHLKQCEVQLVQASASVYDLDRYLAAILCALRSNSGRHCTSSNLCQLPKENGFWGSGQKSKPSRWDSGYSPCTSSQAHSLCRGDSQYICEIAAATLTWLS